MFDINTFSNKLIQYSVGLPEKYFEEDIRRSFADYRHP